MPVKACQQSSPAGLLTEAKLKPGPKTRSHKLVEFGPCSWNMRTLTSCHVFGLGAVSQYWGALFDYDASEESSDCVGHLQATSHKDDATPLYS
eukprot:1106419-Amphidinium_carterae.2